MSKLETNTIDTVSGTSTLQVGSTNTSTITLGVSGDTINVPSGVTINNNGTQTGFGGTNTPAFKVNRNGSNQSISTASSTKLAHNNVVFDTDSGFDTTNNRFTVPSGKAGKYFIGAAARFDSSVNASRLLSMLYKNGGNVAEENMNNDDEVSASVFTILDLSAGDYLEHYVYQNTGSTKSFKGQNITTYFFGYRLVE